MSQESKNFGRADAETLVRLLNLFYNRTIAYAFDHPVTQETVPKVFEAVLKCMGGPQGSLSLLFQEFGYYIGQFDLVYAPNNRRIADHLRRFGVESISVTGPLTQGAFARFLDACALTHADAARFMAYLAHQGVSNFAVNNVTLQTVKEGDVVMGAGSTASAQAGGAGPGPGGVWHLDDGSGRGGQDGAGRRDKGGEGRFGFDDMAMRVVLGHLTAKEMSANLSLLNVLENPAALPDALMKAAAGNGNNPEVMRQGLLNVVGAFKAEAGQGKPIEELLAGMYGMRAELLKAVKAQQSLAQHSAGAPAVGLDAADDIFVNTAAQLVLAEYQKCKGNPKRMAQVIQRIVPDRHHLQKVLGVFRTELLKQGTPLSDFYNLLTELNALMGADQSYREFLEAGQSLGVSSDELLRELQADPKQAAQLIVLASEARRLNRDATGEDLVRSLADYVEKAGDSFGARVTANPKEAGKLSSMLHEMEAEVNRELQQKNIPEEVRAMGQQKLRLRMQRSVADLKGKAALAQLKNAGATETEKVQFLLEMFADEKEMDEVMGLVRESLDSESVARDLGDQVMHKVRHEMNARKEKHVSKELPAGVYVKAVLDFFIKFEVSRSLRYNVPFSAILVSFQGLPEDKVSHEQSGDALRGLQNVLIGDLRHFLRESDFVGYIAFNRFLVVLPMTMLDAVPAIVRKFQENLTRQVALPNGTRLGIKPRCGVAAFDKDVNNTYQKIYAELSKSWQAQPA